MKNWFVARCCATVWWVCVMVWFHLKASSKYGFPSAGVPSSPTHRFVVSPLRWHSWLFFASHSSLCRCWRPTRAALCCSRYGSCMGLKTWIRTRKKESRLLPWVVGAARVGAAGHIASAMAGRIGVLALNAENSVLQEVEMVVSQIRPRRFSGVEVGWLIKRPFQSVSLGVLRTSYPSWMSDLCGLVVLLCCAICVYSCCLFSLLAVAQYLFLRPFCSYHKCCGYSPRNFFHL